ncbi:hypothetical protein WJX84_006747 [Apatococcus fuscideae]|uniref:AB hydrolase-1 domain-containing protein n=1 Tax=Apatococcus fuscideae TaxID=2026836 RepID=A0AAW1TEM3_9CHLO
MLPATVGCGRPACSRPPGQRGLPLCLCHPSRLQRGRGSRRGNTCRAQNGSVSDEFLPFMPPQVSELKDPAALDLLRGLQREPIFVPELGRDIQTAFIEPSASAVHRTAPPVLLLHSFDGSCLEFRRLHPILSASLRTWAVDLAGWGFTDCGFGDAGAKDQAVGPQQKREHLHAFWKQQIKEPMVLLGTSLGGAVALDFALAHPEAVHSLVLLNAQGFADGLGSMTLMPRFVASFGVQVLRTTWLRQMANKMAYYNKPKFATNEAMLAGRLHTWLPGWQDASISFIQSGGYAITQQVKDVSVRTLILWGRNDEILDIAYAQRFADEIADSELVYLEECGHSGHLEQPEQVAKEMLRFLGLQSPEETRQPLAEVSS